MPAPKERLLQSRPVPSAARDTTVETDQHYRLLFDAHPQPMWVFDQASKRLLAVNNAAIARYGYSREAFLAVQLGANCFFALGILIAVIRADRTSPRQVMLTGAVGAALVIMPPWCMACMAAWSWRAQPVSTSRAAANRPICAVRGAKVMRVSWGGG